MSNFIKISPMGAALKLRTDGQTDRRTGGHYKAFRRLLRLCERALKWPAISEEVAWKMY